MKFGPIVIGMILSFSLAGTVNATTTISADITTGGNLTVDGNATLGNAAADVITLGGTLAGASPLLFEGATADGFETTFAMTDPTADNTITFQDGTGTVAFLSDIPAAGANTALSNLSSVAINTALKGVDGTVSAPAYSFTNATGTGLYLFKASNPVSLGAAVNGVLAMRVDEALTPDNDGGGNTVLGFGSGLVLSTTLVGGTKDTFIGGESGVKVTTGSANTYVGSRSGHENVTGEENTCVGQGSCYSNTNTGNVAIGYHSMLAPLGTNSVVIGDSAGEGLNAGTDTLFQDVFVGYQAGRGHAGLNAANNNVAVGFQALTGLTTGDQNVGVGTSAGGSVTTGSNNIALGKSALAAQATNDNSIAIGVNSLLGATADQNVSIGTSALIAASTASNAVAVGYQAGFGVDGSHECVTGAGDTLIGFEATCDSGALTNATALGNGAIVTASNTIQLGNTSVASVVTSGGFTFGGHLKSTAPASSDATTGTCGSVTVSGTDTRGTVTATCTAGQTVIMNFGTTYGSAPVCVISPANSAASAATSGIAFASATTGALTLTAPTAATGGIWKYICIE